MTNVSDTYLSKNANMPGLLRPLTTSPFFLNCSHMNLSIARRSTDSKSSARSCSERAPASCCSPGSLLSSGGARYVCVTGAGCGTVNNEIKFTQNAFTGRCLHVYAQTHVTCYTCSSVHVHCTLYMIYEYRYFKQLKNHSCIFPHLFL